MYTTRGSSRLEAERKGQIAGQSETNSHVRDMDQNLNHVASLFLYWSEHANTLPDMSLAHTFQSVQIKCLKPPPKGRGPVEATV